MPGIDHAMKHEGVERIERASLDDSAVRVGVAVGDPALAIGTDTGDIVVALIDGSRRSRIARMTGRRIVEMVLEDLKPRDIMTPGAFRNAVAAVWAARAQRGGGDDGGAGRGRGWPWKRAEPA